MPCRDQIRSPSVLRQRSVTAWGHSSRALFSCRLHPTGLVDMQVMMPPPASYGVFPPREEGALHLLVFEGQLPVQGVQLPLCIRLEGVVRLRGRRRGELHQPPLELSLLPLRCLQPRADD